MDTPEIDASDLSIGETIMALRNQQDLPVWVCIKKARHKVGPDGRDGVIRGLLIALEINTKDL